MSWTGISLSFKGSRRAATAYELKCVTILNNNFISVTQEPNSGLGHFIVNVSRSHMWDGWAPNEWSSCHRGRYRQNTQQIL